MSLSVAVLGLRLTWIIGGLTGLLLFPAERIMLEEREEGEERDGPERGLEDMESPGPRLRPR